MFANILHAASDISLVGPTHFEMLKSLARMADNKRSRLILTPGYSMVICLHRDSYVRPHRHPAHKQETYSLVEGELEVDIFMEDGMLALKARLDAERPVLRTSQGWYHQPKARSEFAIYQESYTWPFKKEEDVFYAPWAKEE